MSKLLMKDKNQAEANLKVSGALTDLPFEKVLKPY